VEDRISQARNIDMVSYLSAQGFHPVKEKGDSVYYLSPFRDETAPSFCISLSKNKWIDFGRELKRKDIIDFVREMESCELPAALDKLLGGDILTKHEYSGKPIPSKSIEVIDSSDSITNATLIDYMEVERKIPIEVVNKYCQEVSFQFTDKRYTIYHGVGMPNDSGGWTIRSTWFKGATSPANITTVKEVEGSTHISLFEGITDWFSYVVLYGEPNNDCIILNSLVYIPMIMEKLKGYSIVHCWMDNDAAADDKVSLMISEGVSVIDHRATYEEYGDLNEYLQNNFDI